MLDNKPFGPVLSAIFHRMPTGIVDRRLFYVEPDPAPPVGKPRAQHSPIEVGLASITSIPGHEGIADDLDNLIEHNHRVRWLLEMKRRVQDGLKDPTKDPKQFNETSEYDRTRIECIARTMVLESVAIPSAMDFPRDARTRALLMHFRAVLIRKLPNAEKLDSYDIVFHLRRLFYLLYALYNKIEGSDANSPHRDALHRVGRLIKALKIVHSRLLSMRDALIAELPESPTEDDAEKMLAKFSRFLAVDGNWWKTLADGLQGSDADAKSSIRDRKAFLDKQQLSRLASALRDIDLADLAHPKLNTGPKALEASAVSGTILDCVADATRRILTEHEGMLDLYYDGFRGIDEVMYPIEFASGIYEIDEIEFVRISPQDAQEELSKGDARGKVAGDDLAHFSAFLCRDWRSNDIIQGRLDGICQIVRSLVDDRAVERAIDNRFAFDEAALDHCMPQCPNDKRKELIEVWREVKQEWGQASDKTPLVQKFQNALIAAGQTQVFNEDIESVYADLYYQEIRFGQRVGTGGATGASTYSGIEEDANKQAKATLARTPEEDRWNKYKKMEIGNQAITGPQGRVPYAVLGEYASLAYMKLWSMVRNSLAAANTAMDRDAVRGVLRSPVQLLYYVFFLIRREPSTAATVIALILGTLLGIIGFAAWYSNWLAMSVSVLVLIAVITILKTTVEGIGLVPGERGSTTPPPHSGSPAEPGGWLPKGARMWLFLMSSVGTAALSSVICLLMPKSGFMALTLAAVTGRGADFLQLWGEAARQAAALTLGLDFVLLLFYPVLLSLVCGFLARHSDPRSWSWTWGGRVTFFALLAMPLDILENLGLWRLLNGVVDGRWPWLTAGFTAGKMTIILIVFVYLVVATASIISGIFGRLARRRSRPAAQ